jgi:chitinase
VFAICLKLYLAKYAAVTAHMQTIGVTHNEVCLLQELSKEFQRQQPPLVLAVALSGYKEVIEQAYDLSAIGRYVDFVSVMTYDYHGAWENILGHVSPLYYRIGDHFPQYNTVR